MGDQIARLCIDGTAKFPTFLVPTIEHQLKTGGPIRRATLALAGWARYLAVVPSEQQSPDASGDLARRLARDALHEPIRFLELDCVFPATLRDSERLQTQFIAAADELAARGPISAMGALGNVSAAPPTPSGHF